MDYLAEEILGSQTIAGEILGGMATAVITVLADRETGRLMQSVATKRLAAAACGAAMAVGAWAFGRLAQPQVNVVNNVVNVHNSGTSEQANGDTPGGDAAGVQGEKP